jgi:hypothetical protein
VSDSRDYSDVVHDAIAQVLEGEGLATGGVLLFVWTTATGHEQVTMVPTDGVGIHSLLGLGEWLRAAMAAELIQHTTLEDE